MFKWIRSRIKNNAGSNKIFNINNYIVSESELEMERKRMRYRLCHKARDEVRREESIKRIRAFFRHSKDSGELRGDEEC